MALVGANPAFTTYTGPRFPGGPDSLQAAIQRLLRPASPTLAGQVFLRLELDDTGTPKKSYFLLPTPATPEAALATNPEVLALEKQLVAQLPSWQLAASIASQPKSTPTTVTLPLTFGPGSDGTALNYSDENPTFPAVPDDRRSGVQGFIQKRVRYPANDLRNRVQGTVYAYFEVSETGVVAQRRIVGTLSPTLDAEVLRVLALLPNANTPPRLAGRPVRVGYVLPLSFRVL